MSSLVSITADASFKARAVAFMSAIAMIAILAMIGAITLVVMARGPGSARDERVAQTPIPPHDLKSLKRFMGDAKYYISQRYAGKQTFIAINGEVKMRLFGHSPTPAVLLGHRGTLFLGDGDGIGNDIDSTIGTPPLAFASDAAWLDLYKAMGDAFRARHIPLVQIIAPDKSAVFPEDLPDWIVPRRSPRGADLVQHIAQYSAPSAVDLFALMADLRRRSPELVLYHATDTHWSELGAALAIDAALAPLGHRPVPAGPPAYQMVGVNGGDLARMVGRQEAINAQAPTLVRAPRLSCVTPEGKPAVLITIDPLPQRRFNCNNPDAPPGHALVFMDSFGMAVVPRLMQYFRNVTFVWSDKVSMNDVDETKPDVVIRIMVARKLQSAYPADMFKSK